MPKLPRFGKSISAFQTTATAVLDAGFQGDTETLEKLLYEGADPNVQNAQGETALHLAVRHGHEQTAACLLAYGADHTVVDNRGHTPLSLDYTNLKVLHAIRQRYGRVRTRESVRHQPSSAQVATWVSTLDRQGIIKLSGLIELDALTRMQTDFQAFIRNLEGKIARGESFYRHYDEEEHWWPKDLAYISNNAFKYSIQLVEFCCHETLLEVANLYLGKTAFIQRGNAMRYLPTGSSDEHMFGWHHDMEDKRLKVMILLTDIGAHDQYMSYVLGSHKLFHPITMFIKNKCSLAYCREHLGEVEIYDTIGQAGDVFLFDSNGAHRGNRRLDASVRDTFFVEYTADRSDIWGGDISQDVFDDIPLHTANPFEWMMAVEKKWNMPVTRKAPTWLENLSRVETWL